MLDWLTSRVSTTVSIDLNTSCIALMKLSGTYKRPKVNYFALGAMPDNGVKDDLVIDEAAVSQALTELLITSKCKAKSAAINALGTNVLINEVIMDKGSTEEEIESFAWVDVYKKFSDISTVCLDFEILGDDLENPGKQIVLVAACRNNSLQKTLVALEKSGLQTRIIDVSYYAMGRVCDFLLRQLPEHRLGHPIGLINIGREWTKKVVFLDGTVVHQFDHAFAGDNLMKRVQALLNAKTLCALDESETANVPKKLKADYEALIIKSLMPQVERYIDFFYTSTGSKSFDHLYLSGDCALLPNCTNIVEGITRIPTSVANPFLSMRLHKSINKKLLYHQAPRLILSCGLALHEVCHGTY